MKRKDYFKITAALLAGILIAFSACKKDDDDDDDDDDNGGTPSNTITVTDDGSGTGTTTWSSSKTVVLDGFVFVNDGQTLTIEAGTMIQGKPGEGENASALIVARGGPIIANGTSTNPIIFTGEGDTKEGTYLKKIQGLWGGLIILGKATNNNPTNDKLIEGIPTNETRGKYGGSEDTDNSGSLQYISIRHGGTEIGAGNEINGLTLGSVGSGTTFDYIEVIGNLDDGVEFFGGAPQLKHVIVTYCGDDSYDYDEGFHGKGQFWLTIQGDEADRCAEQDGGPSDNETGTPYAEPLIYNATYISDGEGNFMIFRDNAAGTYANSIFSGNDEAGIQFEYRNDKHSSLEWLTDASPAATLMIKNCIFHNMGTDTTQFLSGKAEKGTLPANTDSVVTQLFASNSNSWDTLMSISGSNPIPASGANGGTTPPTEFFENVTYQGAFEPGGTNWASGWSLYFDSKK